MRRVARIHGVVAGYVWDFGEELSPSGPFRSGMREVVADLPALPGSEDSSLGALRSLFGRAGLEEIATRTVEVTVSFPNFADFWLAQTPSYSPMTKMIAAMTISERARLTEAVRAHVPIRETAGSNIVHARTPSRHGCLGDLGSAEVNVHMAVKPRGKIDLEVSYRHIAAQSRCGGMSAAGGSGHAGAETRSQGLMWWTAPAPSNEVP